ncbi:MAG: type 1 glutamine amidotransferase [Aldersonia sp.]|nr:type 1 glutamine amidotransferase [Aldersonia sp.]
MKPTAVVAHVGRGGAGLVEKVGAARGRTFQVYRPVDGQALPALPDIDGIVVLGGPQSAYDVDRHPYLAEEERFLAAAVEAGTPVLAICLGSQILARALGGSAQPGPLGLEAGFIEVDSVSGVPDRHVAGTYFSFHSDTFIPPPDAQVLAVSDRYTQAWTLGSALAVQFHPEMTHTGVDALLQLEGEKLSRFGVDVASIRRGAERYFAAAYTDAWRFLNGWFDRHESQSPPGPKPR